MLFVISVGVMEYILLIFMRACLSFRGFSDMDINYLLDASGIHIIVFILVFKFPYRGEFDPVWGKRD